MIAGPPPLNAHIDDNNLFLRRTRFRQAESVMRAIPPFAIGEYGFPGAPHFNESATDRRRLAQTTRPRSNPSDYCVKIVAGCISDFSLMAVHSVTIGLVSIEPNTTDEYDVHDLFSLKRDIATLRTPDVIRY
nr:hypothetical protein Iba_chr07aCG13170 [Ipomoea batatas]